MLKFEIILVLVYYLANQKVSVHDNTNSAVSVEYLVAS